MGLWNVWTALVTGLLIGGSIGMLLTAMLRINNRYEMPQPETRTKKATGVRVSGSQGDNVAAPHSIESPTGARVPLHFH
jgi:hypothetical protein